MRTNQQWPENFKKPSEFHDFTNHNLWLKLLIYNLSYEIRCPSKLSFNSMAFLWYLWCIFALEIVIAANWIVFSQFKKQLCTSSMLIYAFNERFFPIFVFPHQARFVKVRLNRDKRKHALRTKHAPFDFKRNAKTSTVEIH